MTTTITTTELAQTAPINGAPPSGFWAGGVCGRSLGHSPKPISIGTVRAA